jgi:hypothetical protein
MLSSHNNVSFRQVIRGKCTWYHSIPEFISRHILPFDRAEPREKGEKGIKAGGKKVGRNAMQYST